MTDGRAFRLLRVLDEFTRECVAIRVKRRGSATEAIDVLFDLSILRGPPAYVRSDNDEAGLGRRPRKPPNGFVAQSVRNWITAVGAKTASP